MKDSSPSPAATAAAHAVESAADRFDRARMIKGWDQDRLASATAVVVGVGALGNEVAKNLALAGVGRLILCDPDTVDITNLSRTVLFGTADVGRPKVLAAGEALAPLSQNLDIEARHADLVSGVGLGELADADLIFGCLDSTRSRMQLLGRCALVDKALIDGGTRDWGGEVRIRLAVAEPCYACAMTPHQRGTTDLPWNCGDAADGAPAPASIAVSALVAAWMTAAGLNALHGFLPEYRVLDIDGRAGRVSSVAVSRDPGCPHHAPLVGAVRSCAASARSTVRMLLDTLSEGDEPIAWQDFPVSEASQDARGYDVTQGYSMPCAECPSRRDSMSACSECTYPARWRSQFLRKADPAARLGELGVAPQEILPVRSSRGDYQWHRLSR